MLITECDKTGRACRFVVSPNNSHGTRGKMIVFAAILLVSIMIAFRFWLLGAWMVMPLMLLEMAVLGGAFYLVHRSAKDREVIDISETGLNITRHHKSQVKQWNFQPYWVQVILSRDKIKWYPTHLRLRSHGKSIEIGTCLTDEEREELSENLKHGLELMRPVERI